MERGLMQNLKEQHTARLHASVTIPNELKSNYDKNDITRIIKENLADALANEITERIYDNFLTVKFLQNEIRDETEYTIRINLISDKKYYELFMLEEEK